MPGTDPFAFTDLNVLVSCTLTIDGREYTARQAYSRSSYKLMKDDPAYKAYIESDIRHALGRMIVDALAPAVVVQEPSQPEWSCDIGRATPGNQTCASYPDCTCGG